MQSAAKYIALGALFAIPFLPLYVANDLFFPFITGKGFAFRILVEIAVVAFLLLALLDKRYRPQISIPLILFTAFVAWMAVANALGVMPHKAFWSNFERMDGWVTLIHVFGLFLVAGTLLTVDKLWRKWWLVFLSVAGVVAAIGIMQLLCAGSTCGESGQFFAINQSGTRVDARVGNAIYLAVYMMFAYFAALWLAIDSRGWKRYLLLVLAGAAATVLFFTASRGALVGLAAGSVLAALLWMWQGRAAFVGNGGKRPLGVTLAAGGLVGLTLLGGAFFLARDSAFVQNDPALARLSTVFSLSQELTVRATIWGMALKGVADDPITGWGQEGFNQVFNKYYEPSLYAQEPWFDRAHNMYIDWLVAGGIPALVLFVSLIGYAAFILFRSEEASAAERVFLVSALGAYAVQGLVAFDNLLSYIPLAMLLAMAHATASKPLAQIEGAPELKSEAGVGMASAGAIALGIALIWVVNVPNMRAANQLVYAMSAQDPEQGISLFRSALQSGTFATQEISEQTVQFAPRVVEAPVSDRVKVDAVMLAVEAMQAEVERSQNDARLRILYAGALETSGNQEAALTELDAAVALSPRKQALILNRAYALERMGRDAEAQEAFRKAYELDPSFDQVAMQSAAGLILTGDTAGARELLLETVGTTTPDNQSIFYAYYATQQWDALIATARARILADGGTPESRFRLAQAFAAAGRIPEARTEIQATIAAFPQARAAGEALLTQITAPQR